MELSSEETVSSLRTRPSLLGRVRQWDDSASWNEFYRLYKKLIYGLARRSGLPHAEAEDVTQDVFKRVAETIHQFESDPNRGKFRGWLMNLTRWRIANKFARRPQEEVARAGGHTTAPEGDGATRTSTINRLPDPAELEAAEELEWQRHLLDAASERIAKRVKARHYQVFDLYVRHHWPVLQVARELGMNPATVYVVAHRLTRELKAEVAKLREQMG
jgi:RNA polymerase sigma factor (sigma-70 family)